MALRGFCGGFCTWEPSAFLCFCFAEALFLLRWKRRGSVQVLVGNYHFYSFLHLHSASSNLFFPFLMIYYSGVKSYLILSCVLYAFVNAFLFWVQLIVTALYYFQLYKE